MHRAPRLLVLLAAALAACSPEPDPVPEPPHLLYSADPMSLDNPFPDGRLLGEQGLALRPDWYRPFLLPRALTRDTVEMLERYSAGASSLDGFGNYGGTLLRVSEPVARDSFGGIAARLTRSGGTWQVVERDVRVLHSLDALEGTEKTAPEGYPEFLRVVPSVPLPEDAEGMLVLLRGLRTADGAEFGRGFEFEAEVGAQDRIREAAAALGVPEEDVLLALPQHPVRAAATLKSLAKAAAQMPAPGYQIPAKQVRSDNYVVGHWRSSEGDWGTLMPWLERQSFSRPASDVGDVVVGTFSARDLRRDGVIQRAWLENPFEAPTNDLLFVLTLPKGPKPEGGWPVVIGGHGLGGRNSLLKGNNSSFCAEVAQVLASVGHACLGIDAASHGSRGNAFDFFALDDLRRARDNFRQTAFDMSQLASLAAVLDVDGDGEPELSMERLGYFGNSLGGIMGGNFVALEDRIHYGVINVGGAGLANILESEEIRDRIGLLLVAETNLAFESVEYFAAFPLFSTVGQLFLEAGDPINVAHLFRETDRAVLVQEGVRDRVIPNQTTRALAQRLGADEIASSLSGSAPLRIHVRVDATKYGRDERYNGHNVFWDFAPPRTQVLTFLQSSGTSIVLE